MKSTICKTTYWANPINSCDRQTKSSYAHQRQPNDIGNQHMRKIDQILKQVTRHEVMQSVNNCCSTKKRTKPEDNLSCSHHTHTHTHGTAFVPENNQLIVLNMFQCIVLLNLHQLAFTRIKWQRLSQLGVHKDIQGSPVSWAPKNEEKHASPPTATTSFKTSSGLGVRKKRSEYELC